MIARLAPSAHQVAAACFPVPGCTVGGYAHRAGYCLTIGTPASFAGPRHYRGQGRTCFEALAAAVQLFHDSAHAYPAARLLAAADRYGPPTPTPPGPRHDKPAPECCPQCGGSGTNHHELAAPGKWVRGGDLYECYTCEGLGYVPATN